MKSRGWKEENKRDFRNYNKETLELNFDKEGAKKEGRKKGKKKRSKRRRKEKGKEEEETKKEGEEEDEEWWHAKIKRNQSCGKNYPSHFLFVKCSAQYQTEVHNYLPP